MAPGAWGATNYRNRHLHRAGSMHLACATVLCLGISLMAAPSAQADSVGYSKIVDLSAESLTVRAEHHHDWSHATHAARWKMISGDGNPFTAANNYAYLRLHDKMTGTELFRKPVPALSYIWVSPDARYVVGISNIMLWNPYQLVVFSRSGERLLERDLVNVTWPGVSRSVTNWLNWYKEPIPKIGIIDNGVTATLSIEDTRGVPREFEFSSAQ
jgi:hypothetical protein